LEVVGDNWKTTRRQGSNAQDPAGRYKNWGDKLRDTVGDTARDLVGDTMEDTVGEKVPRTLGIHARGRKVAISPPCF